jgi:hypothetical protein
MQVYFINFKQHKSSRIYLPIQDLIKDKRPDSIKADTRLSNYLTNPSDLIIDNNLSHCYSRQNKNRRYKIYYPNDQDITLS